jgi:predicted ATPase/class 3 adenylate cyclase/Tfp pilus assembly protein PilF
MPNPPSGTVTFLFTDIEGSTKRWEAHPQQMHTALSRHDAILRSAIEKNGGYVFKTVGDAFCAAFSSPHQALSAALVAQPALHDEQWPTELGSIRVRMALHTGAVEEQAGDYFGQPLNRVARLLSAGHGGQTLLSEVTYGLIRDNLPLQAAVSDLGEHRLKDLYRPEHIFQLDIAGLPSVFLALKTLDYRPNNLPAQPTSLIGREKELLDLHNLLRREDLRLATLTGPGGIGKTRLALQLAADILDDFLDDFPDGAWFINLAPITDPGLMTSTIAQALGVKEMGGQPLIDTLKSYLGEKHLLLLVDNFEQVISAAAQLSELLASCPHLKMLVTSRIALRLRGEREYSVPPLPLPDPNRMPSLELQDLTQFEAVRLFIERAQGVQADFEVTNHNAPAVAEICVRLDGLPLAIELAAARVTVLPPQAMLSRLENRLRVLTGGARDLPARQQTLRNTIEWSYELLTEGEKQLFRRMAVFQGGRTLDALEAVCNHDGQLQIDALDGVEALVGNSLLGQRLGANGEPRFWMLETIHEYAREKLRESGEAPALQREHTLYFMRLAEEAEPHLTGQRQQEWLDRLGDEYDNIRAALDWASEYQHSIRGVGARNEEAAAAAEEVAEGTAEVGLRLAGALWRFWVVKSLFTEGRKHLRRLLELTESEASTQERPSSTSSTSSTLRSRNSIRAKALNGAGFLALRQGDYPAAQSLLNAALEVGREIRDKQIMAFSLNGLGIAAQSQGDSAAARALYEESLVLKREIGDKRGIAASLGNLGIVAQSQGDYPAARSLIEESLVLEREFGSKVGIPDSLNTLGGVAQSQGDYPAARALYEESLVLGRELGDKWGIANSLRNLGSVAMEQGDYPAARSLIEESLVLKREIGDKRGIADSLNNLGIAAQSQGDYPAARSLIEESLVLRREIGDKRGIAISLNTLGAVAMEQGDYPAARSLLEESLVLRKEIGDKKGAVQCIAGLGGVAIGGGQEKQVERGTKLLGATEWLLQGIGAVLDRVDRERYEWSVQQARSLLGEEAFEKAMAEGRAMSMEEAIEYALGDTDTIGRQY